VVEGSGGADGLVSAPGVDCNGGVACAITAVPALSRAIDSPETATPAATKAQARSKSLR
jgi:hypothetical protein